MSIESLLERIAVALEARNATPDQTAKPATEPDKPRGPGRPPKAATAAAAAPAKAPEPAVETDPFAVDDPAPAPVTYTKDQVRAALVDYQKRTTPGKARGLLKSVGGVDTLGQLTEDKFAAVIAATK